MLLDVDDGSHKSEVLRKEDRLWNSKIIDEGSLVASLLHQGM